MDHIEYAFVLNTLQYDDEILKNHAPNKAGPVSEPLTIAEQLHPHSHGLLTTNTLVLADFYSDSCIPCKRLSPVLFELEKEYEGKLKIAKINVNFDFELASEYEVQAAPTLVFFKNGEEKERLRGAVKKSEIIEVTEKLIKE